MPAGTVTCSKPVKQTVAAVSAATEDLDSQKGAQGPSTEDARSNHEMKTHHWVVVLGIPAVLFALAQYRMLQVRMHY